MILKERVHLNPNWNEVGIRNDIALLHLPDNIHSIDSADWATIKWDAEVPVGSELTVAGWGVTSEQSGIHEYSTFLQKVNIPVISMDTCRAWTNNQIDQHDEGEVFCSGLISGGRDSCRGDSGGPFFRKENDVWVTYGVVSYGLTLEAGSCAIAQNPAIYARIRHFRTWLEATMAAPAYSTFKNVRILLKFRVEHSEIRVFRHSQFREIRVLRHSKFLILERSIPLSPVLRMTAAIQQLNNVLFLAQLTRWHASLAIDGGRTAIWSKVSTLVLLCTRVYSQLLFQMF